MEMIGYNGPDDAENSSKRLEESERSCDVTSSESEDSESETGKDDGEVLDVNGEELKSGFENLVSSLVTSEGEATVTSPHSGPCGSLFYSKSPLELDSIRENGLTQLKINFNGKVLGLRKPKSKKTEHAKINRRSKNSEDILVDSNLEIHLKSAHTTITLPDEIELFSLTVKNSTGIKNSLVIPLGVASYRKLANVAVEPKRKKTKADWLRIRGE